ncbi:MAG: RHS domain-containing protein [Acidobacteria bacterium]|nr:RHS domain-containing protein [Acidobacteriota bacterium]
MFRLREEQLAELRRHRLADALVEELERNGCRADWHPRSATLVASDPEGHHTEFRFDSHGYLGGLTAPSGRNWDFTNDTSGSLRELTAPSGLKLGFEYDLANRVAQVSRNGKPVVQLAYQEASLFSEIRYADGTTNLLSYDTDQRLTRITDRLGHAELFQYDTEGRLTGFTDANRRQTEFRYRAHAKPYFVRFPDGTTELYEYDGNDRLRRVIADADVVAEVERDDEGRPTQIQFGGKETSRFTYDALGNLTRAANDASTVEYTYDAEGRVLSETQDGFATRYRHDAQGRLAALTYPGGSEVRFTYDGDARLASITDWNGGAIAIRYDGTDTGEQWNYPSGVVATTLRSSTGRPVSIEVRRGDGTALLGLAYEYDEEERIRVQRVAGSDTRSYSYDAEGQLLAVSSSLPSRSESFSYDAAGNRLNWNHMPASINAVNQVVKQGTVRCGWDRRGNLASRLSRNRERKMVYNAQGLLLRSEDSYGGWVEFTYDAFRRRISKRSERGETRYLWAGEQLIGEIVKPVDGPEVSSDYLLIPGTSLPVALRRSGQVYYYHNDHLGSPRCLSDAGGNTVWSADYLGFGQAIIHMQRVRNNLRFPGQYFDEETGFHYNRFRYYCSGLGRYITRDPISFLGGPNFYVYAGNDPVNATDEDGLWSWKSVGKTILKVGVPIVAAAAVAGLVMMAPVALPRVRLPPPLARLPATC